MEGVPLLQTGHNLDDKEPSNSDRCQKTEKTCRGKYSACNVDQVAQLFPDKSNNKSQFAQSVDENQEQKQQGEKLSVSVRNRRYQGSLTWVDPFTRRGFQNQPAGTTNTAMLARNDLDVTPENLQNLQCYESDSSCSSAATSKPHRECFPCAYCIKSFNSKRGLQIHISKAHQTKQLNGSTSATSHSHGFDLPESLSEPIFSQELLVPAKVPGTQPTTITTIHSNGSLSSHSHSSNIRGVHRSPSPKSYLRVYKNRFIQQNAPQTPKKLQQSSKIQPSSTNLNSNPRRLFRSTTLIQHNMLEPPQSNHQHHQSPTQVKPFLRSMPYSNVPLPGRRSRSRSSPSKENQAAPSAFQSEHHLFKPISPVASQLPYSVVASRVATEGDLGHSCRICHQCFPMEQHLKVHMEALHEGSSKDIDILDHFTVPGDYLVFKHEATTERECLPSNWGQCFNGKTPNNVTTEICTVYTSDRGGNTKITSSTSNNFDTASINIFGSAVVADWKRLYRTNPSGWHGPPVVDPRHATMKMAENWASCGEGKTPNSVVSTYHVVLTTDRSGRTKCSTTESHMFDQASTTMFGRSVHRNWQNLAKENPFGWHHHSQAVNLWPRSTSPDIHASTQFGFSTADTIL